MRSAITSHDTPAEPNARAASVVAWAVLASIAFSSLIVAGFAATRPRSDRLAVVFPPWWTAEHSIGVASEIAPVSGLGAFPFVVAVYARGSDVASRLVDAGAWAVLDGAKFSFCISK